MYLHRWHHSALDMQLLLYMFTSCWLAWSTYAPVLSRGSHVIFKTSCMLSVCLYTCTVSGLQPIPTFIIWTHAWNLQNRTTIPSLWCKMYTYLPLYLKHNNMHTCELGRGAQSWNTNETNQIPHFHHPLSCK